MFPPSSPSHGSFQWTQSAQLLIESIALRNTVLELSSVSITHGSLSLYHPSQEHKQHRGTVLQVLFSPNGSWLYSAGADGGLCVYDVVQVWVGGGRGAVQIQSITCCSLSRHTILSHDIPLHTDVQVYNPVKFLPAGGKGIKVWHWAGCLCCCPTICPWLCLPHGS